MAGMSTAGLAGLVAGEDWHYVGEAGEPAFGTDWANASSGTNLAFRIREAGVVDIQGYIENTNAPSEPSSQSFFILPEGYRPSADTMQGVVVIRSDDASDGNIVAPLRVTSAGAVAVIGINTDPVFSVLGYVGVAQYVHIHGFFFLDPADAP